jgi:alkylation response protein AidB-like acyl-CoA dehydrogenase
MDFDLGEDQAMARDAAREFAREFLAPRAAAVDRDGSFPLDQFREAAARGFAGCLVPEEFGGSALGNLSLALALVEINRACASTGVTLSVHNSLVSAPIAIHGNDGQRRRWLPRLATGELLGAYSLSEASCGSDAAALRCAARRDGDAYVLDGTKLWVTSGSHADLFVVFARTGAGTTGAKGISAFLVEKGSPGFRVGKKEEKLGIRGSSTTELVFEGCRVPAENLLGVENDGFRIAMHTLDGGRIGIASQALGIAEACREASVRYAKERKQFGQAIAEFQPIQWKIAEMTARIESARLLVLRAAWLKDLGRPHTMEASVAKLEASRAANYCAREAVQIHGGAGYMVDFPVERHFRDARITEIYEGTTEIQKIVISRHVLR